MLILGEDLCVDFGYSELCGDYLSRLYAVAGKHYDIVDALCTQHFDSFFSFGSRRIAYAKRCGKPAVYRKIND